MSIHTGHYFEARPPPPLPEYPFPPSPLHEGEGLVYTEGDQNKSNSEGGGVIRRPEKDNKKEGGAEAGGGMEHSTIFSKRRGGAGSQNRGLGGGGIVKEGGDGGKRGEGEGGGEGGGGKPVVPQRHASLSYQKRCNRPPVKRISDLNQVQGLGFRIYLGYRVWGLGFRGNRPPVKIKQN